MLAIVLRRVHVVATFTVACSLSVQAAPAAEWAPVSAGCNSCGTGPAVAMQPVFQPQYRTVPVTSFRPITQTVQRPVTYTEFVAQPYTQYVPVQQPQTRQVRTVQYRNVTEYRTVHRDMGRWVTRYQPIHRPAPYQIDPRRNVAGWWNRTAWSLRNSMTPRMATSRQFVPNVVAQTVPVQRRVAVPVIRNVTHMVTQMVPRTTMRSVPVNRVRYETATVTQLQPVTAYRSVPIGSSMAWAPSGLSTAYAPAAPVVAGSYFPSTVGSVVTGSTAFGSGLAYEVIDDRPVETALSPEPDDTVPRSARNDDKFGNSGRDNNIIDDTDHQRDEFIPRGNEFDTDSDRIRARGASASDEFFNDADAPLKQPYEPNGPAAANNLPPRSSYSDAPEGEPWGSDVPAEEDSLFDARYDGNAGGRPVSQQSPVNQPSSGYKRSPSTEKSPFDDDGFGTEPADDFDPNKIPAFEDGGSASRFRRKSRPHAAKPTGNGKTRLVSLKNSGFQRTHIASAARKPAKNVSAGGWKPSRATRRAISNVSGPKLTLITNQ